MIERLTPAVRILLLFVLWTSLPAASDVLNLPASFIVHEKDMTMWLQDTASKITQPNTVVSQELDLQKPFNTVFKTVSWQGAFHLTWTKKKSDSDVWTFDGELQNLTLYAKDMEVHDTFKAVVDGSTIIVPVNASCQNLALTIPGGSRFHGEMAMSWQSNKLTTVLRNFQLRPGPKAPILKLGACQGPTGLQGFLNDQLATIYKSPQQIQPMAASEIQRFMNEKAAELQAKLSQTYTFEFGKIGGKFNGSTYSSLPSGTWIIDGPLVLSSRTGTQTQTEKKDYTLSTLSDVAASGAAFSKFSIPDVLTFLRRAGVFDDDFTSRQIPGFATFRQHGFEEMIVWADLLNFPETTVFPVHMKATSNPILKNMKNSYPSVSLDVASHVDFLVSAPTPRGPVPYVEFASNAPAQAHIAFAPNNGAMKITSTLLQLPLKYAYRPEYLKIRHPTSGINMSAIQSAMKDSPASTSTLYKLPASLTPVSGYTMGFQGMVYGTKTFRFDMSFKRD